jgi:hypothetical protein
MYELNFSRMRNDFSEKLSEHELSPIVVLLVPEPIRPFTFENDEQPYPAVLHLIVFLAIRQTAR